MRTIVAFVLALLSAGAMAQDRYPTRPIRLLIGFPPGAGMDAVARPYAAKLGELLGQPVVVENRPGAGGAVSNAAIAHAPADGYTLGFGSNGDMVIVPLLIKVDYDPATSFTPISLVSREEGFVLLAHPTFAPRNLAELVALAKEKPGGVQFGSGGVGLPHHIAMEQFKRLARIDMVHVPYKGAGPMTSDIVGGNLMLGIGNVTALPLIRGGKLKALAVTASRRIPALAEVPTFSEQGYAIEASGWFGLIGPAGLPSVVVQTLAAASRKVSEDAAFNERLFGLGMRGEATTSEGLAQLVREDTAKWAKLIRDTGVRIDQ
ncbi:MAG: tripartite tricarboxylate transporter substrate binding protein [Betaproteobacteria bacterium]|nr:MAG: tripartite tricarboxylate transporter substrate binding protein [Betaproteobacteria bacterium]